MDINYFHTKLGETLMYCQIIEHDIKFILAGMLKGDFDENLKKISNLTLGCALKKLEELDYSDNQPFISKSDYKFLNKIKDERNYLAHSIYNNFVYKKNYLYSNLYKVECANLLKFNEKLSNTYKIVEEVRLDCLKKYGRIQ